MRIWIFSLAIVAVAAGLRSVYATDAPVLGLYFVSSEAKPGWRLFDSSAFPKLGYIADRPDLLVSRIKNVYVQTTPQSSTIVHSDGSSETTEAYRPTVVIEFVPDDVKTLGDLTAAHIGQRVLFLLDNEPLFAPVVRTRIDDSTTSVPLPPGSDAQKIMSALQKLCERQ